MMCRKELSTGEELYILDENRFICKEDYISSKLSGRMVFSYNIIILLNSSLLNMWSSIGKGGRVMKISKVYTI